MSESTVMVVTAREDYTSDMVIWELNRRNVPVLRLDPADEQPVLLDARLTPAGWEGTICQDGRTAVLGEVRSVFWRWAWAPPGHPEITDTLHRAWAAKEDHAAIFGVLKSLRVRWINHPDRVAAATKPAQLALAMSVGFPVPQTLITHLGASAARWAADTAGQHQLLYKAFFCQGVSEGGMVPASRVEPELLPLGELYAASMFQHVINGQPMRVTVIGDRVFAAAITSPDAEIDWRPTQQLATITQVSPATDTVTRLGRFMARAGLEYGAFDFIADPSGAWWFLEVNPTGQYGFIEIKTGAGITSAIADRLCQPVSGDRP